MSKPKQMKKSDLNYMEEDHYRKRDYHERLEQRRLANALRSKHLEDILELQDDELDEY